MSDIRIRCRQNGPLVIEGPFTLVDHLGNAFTLPTNKSSVALCRCGQSKNKPFCDGAHKGCAFVAEELAPPQAQNPSCEVPPGGLA